MHISSKALTQKQSPSKIWIFAGEVKSFHGENHIETHS